MTILVPGNGEVFHVRIYKANVNNAQRLWGNTYELEAQAASTLTALVASASRLVEMEKLIHPSNVAFQSMLISTWVPDGTPYNPDSFTSVSLTGAGVRTVGASETLPTGVTWYVSRDVDSGRTGRLFYRGALFESEMQAPAGIPGLTSPSAMETVLQNAVTTPGVDELFVGGLDAFHLVMKSTANVREVVGLTSKGVRLVKTDRKWYNRAPGG